MCLYLGFAGVLGVSMEVTKANVSEKPQRLETPLGPSTFVLPRRSVEDARGVVGGCPGVNDFWVLGPRVLQVEAPGTGGKHISAGCLGALRLCC